MNTKKTIIALSAGIMLAGALPALAESPRWAPDHGYRNHQQRAVMVDRHYRPVQREVVVRRPAIRQVVVTQPVYVQHRPTVIYEEPAYYSAPPVYGAPAVAYEPAGNAAGTIGGAILGAAIGNQIGHGDDRAATTVIGAFIGGLIGSGL